MPAIRWASSLAEAMVKAGCSKKAASNCASFSSPSGNGLILPLASNSATRTVSRFSPPTNQRNCKIVGKNPVGQAVAVTGELLAVRSLAALHLVEIRANVLGLDVAKGHGLADNLKVGAAT